MPKRLRLEARLERSLRNASSAGCGIDARAELGLEVTEVDTRAAASNNGAVAGVSGAVPATTGPQAGVWGRERRSADASS